MAAEQKKLGGRNQMVECNMKNCLNDHLGSESTPGVNITWSGTDATWQV